VIAVAEPPALFAKYRGVHVPSMEKLIVGDYCVEEMQPWQSVHVGPPYLGAALVCQTVFEDAPGLTDVLQIHTTTLISVSPGQEKTTIATGGGGLYLWLRIYAAGAPGVYELDVRFLSPTGSRLARQLATCTLTTDGVSAVIPIAQLATEERGIHYFEIGLDGSLITKVPYEIDILESGFA
jgi:hypothetical protein